MGINYILLVKEKKGYELQIYHFPRIITCKKENKLLKFTLFDKR